MKKNQIPLYIKIVIQVEKEGSTEARIYIYMNERNSNIGRYKHLSVLKKFYYLQFFNFDPFLLIKVQTFLLLIFK